MSSQNRTTHGLLAKSVVLHSESRERFAELLAHYLAEYQPQGPTQNAFVMIMAVAQWRMLRAWNVECAGVNYELDQQSRPAAEPDFSTMETPTRAHFAFRKLGGETPSFELLNRYENRLDRQFRNALNTLCRLQGRKPVLPPTSFFEHSNPISPDFRNPETSQHPDPQ